MGYGKIKVLVGYFFTERNWIKYGKNRLWFGNNTWATFTPEIM